MGDVTVNFIAFDETRDTCLMVLVEGPWNGSTEEHLRSLQDRMFGCLEAALHGQLAQQFPDAMGKAVVVRVDCYDVPRKEVDEFVTRFADGVGALPDYATDASPYVTEFRFEVNHDTLATEG
jgi:hypothetical protein